VWGGEADGVVRVCDRIDPVFTTIFIYEESFMNDSEKTKRGVTVLVASTIINLTIGVLYAWSVLKKRFMVSVDDGGWGWKSKEAGLPYQLGIIFFATGVLVGGKLQDKFGPRLVTTIGSILVGGGLVFCAIMGNNPSAIAIGFGIMTGLGIGFCYSSVTPPVLKWFHPSKKGFVSGITVGAFGFAAIFYAPLVSSMFDKLSVHGYDYAMKWTLLYIGSAIILIGGFVSQLVKNPPRDHVPLVPKKLKTAVAKVYKDYTWKEMLKTKSFYMIHCLFVFSATIGLMMIGNVTKIAEIQADIDSQTFLALLVSLIALMNGLGRMVGGVISDKIGRINTLYIVLTIQMLNMAGFVFYNNIPLIVLGIFFAGLTYGVSVAVFTTLPAERFGIKNYGVNYGFIFTAFGCAGVVAPLIADYFYDLSKSFNTPYIICAAMMPVLMLVAYLLKRDMKKA
jgi:MFS family permease